jgi:hypothetical protein
VCVCVCPSVCLGHRLLLATRYLSSQVGIYCVHRPLKDRFPLPSSLSQPKHIATQSSPASSPSSCSFSSSSSAFSAANHHHLLPFTLDLHNYSLAPTHPLPRSFVAFSQPIATASPPTLSPLVAAMASKVRCRSNCSLTRRRVLTLCRSFSASTSS